MRFYFIVFVLVLSALLPSVTNASSDTAWIDAVADEGRMVVVTDGVRRVGFLIEDIDQVDTGIWLPFENVALITDNYGRCMGSLAVILYNIDDSSSACGSSVWSR